MSDSGQKGRGMSIDRALRTWPGLDETPAAEWEKRAEALVERVRQGDRGTSTLGDAELFAAPFADEGASMEAGSARPSREEERRKLRDLAKLASNLKAASTTSTATLHDQDEEREDSGIIHLASAQLETNDSARPRVQPTSSAAVGQAPPSVGQAPAAVGRAPASVRPAAIEPNIRPTKNRRAPLVMSGLLTLVAAAGAFLLLRSQQAAPSTAPATPPTATVAVVAEPRAEPSPTTPPAPTASALAAADDLDDARDPSPHRAPGKTASKTKMSTSGSATAAKPQAVAAAEPAPPAPNDLGAALKREVGDEPPKVPAAGVTGTSAGGDLPQKPSQGAITGALGAVLPHARACLGPDDPISRAAIVFASSGAVQSVTVTGGAVGKPAEACIRDALQKAKLQPFAEPTSTANITIRHP